MSTRIGAGPVRARYEFIKAHRYRYSVRTMCRVLGVAPSGYSKWLKEPLSNRAQEDARLFRLIRALFVASYGIYGPPRVFLDLREAGETCSKHRVARLMRENNLRARHGYRTRRSSVGKPSVLIPNLLQREFTVTRPNKAWVTDITYIRTWQGWLYLAVVMDLFSRKVVGWSARRAIHHELVLNAVLMAVRRRRPRGTMIHSDSKNVPVSLERPRLDGGLFDAGAARCPGWRDPHSDRPTVVSFPDLSATQVHLVARPGLADACDPRRA